MAKVYWRMNEKTCIILRERYDAPPIMTAPNNQPSPATHTTQLVIGTMLVFIVIISWLCHRQYALFLYDDFDLAIDAQTTWNIAHGSIESSIHSIPFLGNHMRLILFPLALLYRFFDYPMLFVHLQTIVLAAGAWGLYRIARHHLSANLSAVFAILYLMYPPLIHMSLYEFHPIALTTTFFIFMYLAYMESRFRAFVVWMVLALLCQENIPLVLIPFAAFAFLDKRRGRWVFVPLCAGVIYFAIGAMWLMPHFNRGTIEFYQMYGDLGGSMGEIVINSLEDPGKPLGMMMQPRKGAFLMSLLLPLSLLSLGSPKHLIPVLLVLAQRLLSQRPSESTILHHYQAEFIPFIFIAAIYGLTMLRKRPAIERSPVPLTLMIIMTLLSLFLSGVGTRIESIAAPSEEQQRFADSAENALSIVPDDAAVLSSFAFQPKLSNRSGLYSFHHVYDGHYTLSSMTYELPEPVDVILIDTREAHTFSSNGFYAVDGWQRIQKVMDGRWTSTLSADGILMLSRQDDDEPQKLPGSIWPAEQPWEIPVGTSVENRGLTLAGLTLRETGPGWGELSLAWRTSKLGAADCNIRLSIATGHAVQESFILAPGQRIYPPQSWMPEATILDRHNVRLGTLKTDGLGEARIKLEAINADAPIAR